MRKSRSTAAQSQGPRKKATSLGREAWIEAARSALIGGGVARVRIEPLAAQLGVTTGSFYWHFKDRNELLARLLQDWETTNSAALFRAIDSSTDPSTQLNAIADTWLEEARYSPAYDSAIRDWARTAPEVEHTVRRVDDARIALLKGIFQRFGYDDREAFIRARITYFHQVGYYAMRIVESKKKRRQLKSTYLSVLSGRRN
jgi:AcrR family transcriptional regulator